MNNIQLSAFKTISTKECRRILRIWTQTVLPPAITMTLYFLIFGRFLGSHIGKINGIDYIAFITPGFIMMSSLTNSYSNVSGSLFINKFQRSLEDMLVAPISNFVLMAGFMAGGVFRAILIAILVTVIACFFTDLNFAHWGLLIIAFLLSVIPLCAAGFINGLIARKFDDVALIPTFILTPLTYLGGVFYPIQSLPPFWHTVSLFNPIVYMINLFRYGMLGSSDVSVGLSFAVLIGLNVVLCGLAYYLLARGTGIKK
jgi:ABC-2 type transport system permease protein